MANKAIPIHDVCIDAGTQQRDVDEKVVAHYAAMMKDGAKFDPVEIITDGETYFLWDGFHRLAAARKLDKKYIEANVVDGTKRDAIHESFAANKKNAVPRPEGTVKNILRKIYNDDEWHKVSITDTAKHVGCTRRNVIARFKEFDKTVAALKAKKAGGPQGESLFKPGTADVRSKSANVKRGSKEYKQKKPAKKVLDAAGKQVPKHLIKFFKRSNEFRQPIKQLNDMLKAVRDGKNAGDPLFKFVKIENLTAEIGNVKRIFRFGMPYAVCGYCGGDEMNAECRACDGCGFVNEMTYKSTPKELK